MKTTKKKPAKTKDVPLFAVGDPVTIVGHEGPIAIRKIAKVRTRLGKTLGFETTDGQNWDRGGHRSATWATEHIERATKGHVTALRTRRLARALADLPEPTWAALGLDKLTKIARMAGIETERKKRG